MKKLSIKIEKRSQKDIEEDVEECYHIQLNNIKFKNTHTELLEEFINIKDKSSYIIGNGTSSIVYKYSDPKSTTPFAIKYCRKSKLFLQVIKCLDILWNVHFVTSLCAFKIENPYECYLMIPFYPTSLENEIIHKTELLRQHRSKWEVQLCRGLWRLHKHGVYHRDIKPANIMITNNNNIVFVDFGIAEFDIKSFSQKGTISHISYESKRCNFSQKNTVHIKRCKIWHDMYATAITIYEMYAEQKYKGFLQGSFLPHILKKLPKSVISILSDVDNGQKLSKRIKQRKSRSIKQT